MLSGRQIGRRHVENQVLAGAEKIESTRRRGQFGGPLTSHKTAAGEDRDTHLRHRLGDIVFIA
ncbi:MAG: hypothetical protein MZV63_25970 [Marinilabiliales bacterium]|nr:hypothetical protein [Marinilabiliales bacterium]